MVNLGQSLVLSIFCSEYKKYYWSNFKVIFFSTRAFMLVLMSTKNIRLLLTIIGPGFRSIPGLNVFLILLIKFNSTVMTVINSFYFLLLCSHTGSFMCYTFLIQFGTKMSSHRFFSPTFKYHYNFDQKTTASIYINAYCKLKQSSSARGPNKLMFIRDKWLFMFSYPNDNACISYSG